jgi:predicted nucleic acid-binding protein
MTVVDASVVVAAFVGGERADWAATQLSAARARGSLWAPHLIDAEVGHSLRRLVAARRLGDRRAEAALRDLSNMPLRRIVHSGLLGRAWQLRQSLSFYDGLYLALAEQLRVPLLTLDVRLANAATAATGNEVLRPS